MCEQFAPSLVFNRLITRLPLVLDPQDPACGQLSTDDKVFISVLAALGAGVYGGLNLLPRLRSIRGQVAAATNLTLVAGWGVMAAYGTEYSGLAVNRTSTGTELLSRMGRGVLGGVGLAATGIGLGAFSTLIRTQGLTSKVALIGAGSLLGMADLASWQVRGMRASPARIG